MVFYCRLIKNWLMQPVLMSKEKALVHAACRQLLVWYETRLVSALLALCANTVAKLRNLASFFQLRNNFSKTPQRTFQILRYLFRQHIRVGQVIQISK